MKVAAVVLAAGRSDRMGRPKSLLPCGGKTFLRTVLDTLEEASVAEVRVVLGHDADEILRREPLPDGTFVRNPRFEDGMLSSIRCGIRSLDDPDAFLLWPVDHPLVRAATLHALVEAHARSGRGIVVTVHEGARGHPVLFAARLTRLLVEAPDSVGARAVLRSHPDDVEEVVVDDPGVVADIDTPEAYRRFFGALPS